MTLKELVDGVHPHWLAAAAGAAVGLKAMPGATLLERMSNMLAGFFIAAWSGPAIVDYLGVVKASIAAGIVFGVGACGLVLFHSVIQAIKSTDLGDWLRGWLPRRKGGE